MKMRSLSFFLAFCLLQDQSEAFGPSTLRIQKNQGFGTNLYAGTLIESGDASKEEGVNDDDIDIKASGSENVSGEEMISDDIVLDEDKLDEQSQLDIEMMQKAIQMAQSR